jgi:pyridoxine kinase
MPKALILSSHVAASRVGGMAQALALAAAGIEPILVPTVSFGRHPGFGPPGGAAVAAETFAGMLGGVEAQGVFAAIDLVLAGYFASAGQVAAAARAIDKVRAGNPAVRVVVDPIMGDVGKGLYVKPEVAAAIAADLVPRADLLTPNAWEFERLIGVAAAGPAAVAAAVRKTGRAMLVTSVDLGSEIGVVYADAGAAWLAAHPRAASAPNGTGDLLTALFAVALIEQRPIAEALAFAVGGVAGAVEAAVRSGAGDLSVTGTLAAGALVRVERLA